MANSDDVKNSSLEEAKNFEKRYTDDIKSLEKNQETYLAVAKETGTT